MNAYEKARDANIQRNAARLRSLGIPTVPPVDHSARNTHAAAEFRAKAAKRRRAAGKDARPLHEGERKSARLQSLPAVKYDSEAAEEAEARWEVAQGRTRRGRMAMAAIDADAPSTTQEQRIDSADEAAERSRPAQPAPEAPPGSLRTLDADLTAMHTASLGQLLLPPEGSGALKAAVMGMLRGNISHPPKHNKYSGIQEWRNAVTLFVNVCGKTGSVYPNLFSKGGRQMAWFAQPSQSIASPVIHRMLVEDPTLAARSSSPAAKVSAKVKLEAPEAGKVGSTCPVLLFCRQEGEPYVYSGRLRPVDIHAAARPLKVVWELLDFDTLVKCQAFNDLLGGAALV